MTTSQARGINAAGWVVGGALTGGDLAHHGFLFADGQMWDLSDLVLPGLEIVHALGIDDAGNIVAMAARGAGDVPVLLVPEPPPR